ncbi:MAG: hypothetical protein EOO68_00890 [Moraxellaceae bacterium]|nr:MAG: hypothetical protein EOO68_00890 [Moraxellaceae bacterium]
MRTGDWLCPECRAHNFATKTECFKCTHPRYGFCSSLLLHAFNYNCIHPDCLSYQSLPQRC